MLYTALHKYLIKECNTIAAASVELRHTPGKPEAIHVIRVSGKKIRALLELAEQLPAYTFRSGKYLSILKLLQAAGGTARDAQLQQKLLASYEKDLGWRFSSAHLLLREKQATAETLLQVIQKRTNLKKLALLPEKFRDTLPGDDEQTAIRVLHAYITARYTSIVLPAARAHHTHWHALRKEVKALYYQLGILASLLPGSGQEKQWLAATKKAGELLGKWHDVNGLLLFVKEVTTRLKKEKADLPVNITMLLQQLQRDTREHLALCAVQIKKLSAAAR